MDLNALMPNRQQAINDRSKLKPCCKNRKQPWVDGALQTTYRNDYVDKEVPHEPLVKKYDEYPKQPGAKFDGNTTYGGDFKAFAVKPEGPIRPTAAMSGSDAPFNADSTYKNDFGPKEAAYNRVKPKNDYEPNQGPFYGESTYKGDFMAKAVAPAQPITRQGNLQTAGPFEGKTMYQDSYQKWPQTKREVGGPRLGNSDVLPKGRFDDGTMYRTSFVPKEINVPDKFKPKDARPMSSQGWYGGMPSTEYRGQYFGKEVPNTEPIRATRGGDLMPKAPFDGTTTNKTDFKAFAVNPSKPLKPNSAIEHEKLPFTGQTTYKGDFYGKDVPYVRMKPNNAYEPNKAAFDGTTTHRSAFVKMDAPPVSRVAPNRGSNIPNDQYQFDGKTTYKADFAKMPSGPRVVGKGMAAQPITTGPFDGTTTYRLDYMEKEIPMRQFHRPGSECESCIDGIPGIDCFEP